MHDHGYSTREVLDWLISKCATPPAASPAGSDTQVQFNDGGALAGDSGLTWDKTNNCLSVAGGTSSASFTVKCNASDTAFKMKSGAGDEIFAVGATGSNANLAFGDLDETGNHTLFTSQDTTKLMRFAAPGGQITFGDHQSWGNAAQLVVDDANQVVTSNVDIEFTLDSKGPILVDRTTATKYRLYVDNGVLGIEAV